MAISGNQTVISGHQRHSHLWNRTDRNQRSSVVISAALTCGIARIAIRGHQVAISGHQWSSAPLSPVGSLGSQSEVIKSQSVVISGHQRRSHPKDPSA